MAKTSKPAPRAAARARRVPSPAKLPKPPDPAGPDAGEAVARGDDAELAPDVGGVLRRVRSDRGLSLERLAAHSGVSRAMLNQIELGKSIPTIKVLWKIARALEVPFSALIAAGSGGGTRVLRAVRARRLTSADGSFSSRALFPLEGPRRVEFYELRLSPHAVELAEPHAPGTRENLVVTEGLVEIEVDGERHALGPGDAIAFEAGAAHAYRNVSGEPAVMYLVMTYVETMR
jgi:transcriptional regulator with XRE-family HTH domain